MARRKKVFRRRALAAPLSKEAREWLKVVEAGGKGRKRRSRRGAYATAAERDFHERVEREIPDPSYGPILDLTPRDMRPTPDMRPAPRGPAYDWDRMFEDFTSDAPTKPARQAPAPAPAVEPRRRSAPVPAAPAPAPVEARRAPVRPVVPKRSAVVEEVEVFDEPAPRRVVPPREAAPARERAPASTACRFVVITEGGVTDFLDDDDEDEDGAESAGGGEPSWGSEDLDIDVVEGLRGRRGLRAAKPTYASVMAERAERARQRAAAKDLEKKRARSTRHQQRKGAEPTGSFMWGGEAHPTFALTPSGYNGALTLSSRLNAQIALICGDSTPFGLVDCGSGDCFPAGFALKGAREIPKGDYVPGVRGTRSRSKKKPPRRKRR